MSEDQVPQGSIPPKVSPFSKPEGASPVTPVVPGAPRPITVRLKPVASNVPPASAAESAEKTPSEPSPLPSQTPAAHRLTARIVIPEIDLDEPPTLATVSFPVPPPAAAAPAAPVPSAAPSAAAPATVRLRPVGASGTGPTAAAAPIVAPAVSPIQPMPPPTPGSHPLPDGPKPPSSAQVQAAKSKTSRISLDSAIGVAPMSPMGVEKAEPKTIRLKRPADLAAPAPKVQTAPIRQTSRIPDSVLPTQEAAAAEAASVTQKKTLKIRRPGAVKDESAAAAPAGGGEAFPEGVQMTPLSPIDISVREESKVLTGFALACASIAAIVVLLLTLCLGAHAIGTVANKNTTASISGFEIPWPGRISE